MTASHSILFICTGNRARSIMAEGIANGMFGSALEASSAGSRPNPPPHHRAIELLRQHNIETAALRSKGIEEFRGASFDAVVTLCDTAMSDPCPVFPAAAIVHWSLPDPADVEDEALIFKETFQALVEAIQMVATRPGPLRDKLDTAKAHIEGRLAAFR
jgi:protein-tyrosine-phosphatase